MLASGRWTQRKSWAAREFWNDPLTRLAPTVRRVSSRAADARRQGLASFSGAPFVTEPPLTGWLTPPPFVQGGVRGSNGVSTRPLGACFHIDGDVRSVRAQPCLVGLTQP